MRELIQRMENVLWQIFFFLWGKCYQQTLVWAIKWNHCISMFFGRYTMTTIGSYTSLLEIISRFMRSGILGSFGGIFRIFFSNRKLSLIKCYLSEFDDIRYFRDNRIYTLYKDPEKGHSIRIYQVDLWL